MKMLHQGNLNLFLNYKDKFNFPLHLHNALELSLITEGETVAAYGERTFHLRAGDLFVVFPNQIHSYKDSSHVKGYCMGIPMVPFLSAYQTILELKEPVDPVVRVDNPEGEKIVRLFQEATEVWRKLPQVLEQNMRQGYILLIVGSLLRLLQLTDAKPQNGDLMWSLLRYLNEHYHEALTRKDIAKAVGYNESYISHTFSQTLKTTLTEYLVALRLNDACLLLSDSKMPISQIALSLGFGSIRNFNRTFLRAMHMSPLAYRKTTGESRHK